jgi:hypothetical protein
MVLAAAEELCPARPRFPICLSRLSNERPEARAEGAGKHD